MEVQKVSEAVIKRLIWDACYSAKKCPNSYSCRLCPNNSVFYKSLAMFRNHLTIHNIEENSDDAKDFKNNGDNDADNNRPVAKKKKRDRIQINNQDDSLQNQLEIEGLEEFQTNKY